MRNLLAIIATLFSLNAYAGSVSIIVYDGVYDPVTGPAPVAGCSYGCVGTGTVTHRINGIGYGFVGVAKKLTLFIDGKAEDSVVLRNGGPPHPKQDPIYWDTQPDAAGPHTVTAQLIFEDGTVAVSTLLLISVVK